MPASAPELPVWLIYFAGAFGTCLGAAVWAFGSLKKGRAEPSPKGTNDVEIAGALVDSTSVKMLAGEMAGQSLAIIGQTAAIKEQTAALEKQTKAIEDSSRAVIDVKEEMEEVRAEMRARRH